MRKLKKVFGACLSTLLILSMTLGYATPAMAAKHSKTERKYVVFWDTDSEGHLSTLLDQKQWAMYGDHFEVPQDRKSFEKDGKLYAFEGWENYDGLMKKGPYSRAELLDMTVGDFDLAFKAKYTAYPITEVSVTFIDTAQGKGKYTTDYYKKTSNCQQVGEKLNVKVGDSITAPTVSANRLTDSKGYTYQFDGWQKATLKNNKYNVEDKVYSSTDINSGKVKESTIYVAHYSKVPEYTVYYYKVRDDKRNHLGEYLSNGTNYSRKISEEKVLKGENVAKLPNTDGLAFEMGGNTYVVDGWRIDGRGTIYTSEQVATTPINGQVNYYAHYIKKEVEPEPDPVQKVTVEFVDYNKTSLAGPISVDAGTLVKEANITPEDPTRANSNNVKYTFDGWTIDGDSSEKVYSKTGLDEYKLEDNTVFVAHYTETKFYTVKFLEPGKEEPLWEGQVEEGGHVTAYQYTKDNYINMKSFSGWIKNDDKSKKLKKADVEALEITEDTTFTATFSTTAHFYIRKDGVEQYENGDTHYNSDYYYDTKITDTVKERKQIYGKTGAPETQALIQANLNKTLPTLAEVLVKLPELKETYNTNDYYVRWYVMKAEGTWHIDGVILHKDVTVSFEDYDETVLVQPTEVTYGKKVEDTKLTPADPTRADSDDVRYAFDGWTVKGDTSKKVYSKEALKGYSLNANTVFVAHYSETKLFTVRFFDHDGKQIGQTQKIEDGGTATAEKAEETYSFWWVNITKYKRFVDFRTKDGTNITYSEDLKITQDIDFYAFYEDVFRTRFLSEDKQTVLHEEYTKKGESLKETYKFTGEQAKNFKGWYRVGTDLKPFSNQGLLNGAVKSSHDYTPVFKNPTVTFQYDKDNIIKTESITLNTKVGDKVYIFDKEKNAMDAETFRYWLKDDDTETKYSTEDIKDMKISKNTVFTAVFEKRVNLYLKANNKEPKENGGVGSGPYHEMATLALTVKERKSIFGEEIGDAQVEEEIAANINETMPTIETYKDKVMALGYDPDCYRIRWYVLKFSAEDNYSVPGVTGLWHIDGVLVQTKANVTFKNDKGKVVGTAKVPLNTEIGTDNVPVYGKNVNYNRDGESFLGWTIEGDKTKTLYSTEDVAGMKVTEDMVFVSVHQMGVKFFIKADGIEHEEIKPTEVGLSYKPMGDVTYTIKTRKSIYGPLGDPETEQRIADNIVEEMPTAQTFAEYIREKLKVDPDLYRVRWYVLKWADGYWHVDGILVKTKANVTFKDDKNNVLSQANIDLGSTVGDKVFKYEASTLPNRNLDSETFRFWYKGEDKEHLYTSDEVAAMTINDDTVFTAVYEHKVTVYIRYGVEPKEYGNVMLGTYKEVGNRVLTVKERKAIYGDIEEPETEQRIADNIEETMPTADSLKDKLSALGFDSNQYTIRWYVLKFSPEDNYSDPDHVGVWHLDGILVKKPTATFYNGDEQFHQEYVTKGSRVSAPVNTPVKRADASYEYSFKGWKLRGAQGEDVIDFATDDSAVVNSDVEYEAVYEKTENQYNLFFYNDDQVVYKAKVELDDTLVAPENEPTKIGDTAGEFAFQGWKVNGDADAAAYKSFGGLKVSAFESHMKDGLLVFQASYVKKNEENKVVHHLYFHTDHGTIIIGVEDGHKLAKEFIPTSADEPEDKYEEFINRFFGWKEGELPPIEERIPNVSGASLLKLFKAEKEPETFDFDTAITRDMAFDPVYKPENKIRVEFYDNNTQVGKTFFVLKDKETVTTPVAERTNTETVTYSLEGWKMNGEENVISAEDINKMTFGQDTTFYAVFNEQEVQGEEFENPDEDGEVLGEEFVNPDAEISANEETAVLGAAYGKTGDAAPVLVMIVALALSGMLGIAVTYKRRRDF